MADVAAARVKQADFQGAARHYQKVIEANHLTQTVITMKTGWKY